MSRDRSKSKSKSHSSSVSPSSKEADKIPEIKDEVRSKRKELEKKYGYGYTEPILLGLLGVGMLWNIERQVRKHEEKDQQREQERLDREELHRRRREDQIRAGTWDPRMEHANRDRRNEWGDRDRDRDRNPSRYRADDCYGGGGRRGSGGGGDYRDDYHRGRGDYRDHNEFRRGRHDEEDARGRGGDYRDDEYRGGGAGAGAGGGRPDPRALEYRGYRDQYRDLHNDHRYEDRRDGSLRRTARRDSF